jgi:Response regulator containing a CheY-like receiver domain and an HTH DNA-binding domain
MTRVMIVEDAELIRMEIRNTLIKHGHEVVAEVAEGEEAIQTYLQLKPEIVLMNITMPNINEEEALKKLLVMDPKAKVVMCPSLGQQAIITESMKIGSMGFIVKPFETDEIIDIMRKIAEPN